MQLLLSLVFFASIAGLSCEDVNFKCYRNCTGTNQPSTFLDICRLALPNYHIPTPCNVTADSPLGCYQKCDKSNLTNVLDESAGIFNASCAKEDGSLEALRANAYAFCSNWEAHVNHNCSKLKGCDWTACTFDKTVNDIAYAYSEGSVKYATSLVKLLLGALPENPDLPVDKGCDIIYRTRNAANGLHATGLVITLASITALIHAL